MSSTKYSSRTVFLHRCANPSKRQQSFIFALRRQRSHVRIVPGAPFAYKTTNICSLGLAAGDDVREGGFFGDNPDLLVVHFDPGDHRPQVGLLGLDVAALELLPHQFRKGFDALGGYFRAAARLCRDSVQRRPRKVPFTLQRLDPKL